MSKPEGLIDGASGINMVAERIFDHISGDGSGQLVEPAAGRAAIDIAYHRLMLVDGCTPQQADVLCGLAVGGLRRAKERICSLRTVEDFCA